MVIRLALLLLLCVGITQADVVPFPINSFTGTQATFPVTSSTNFTLQATGGSTASTFNQSLIVQGSSATGGGGGNHTAGSVQIIGGSGNVSSSNIRGGNVFITGGAQVGSGGGADSGYLIESAGTCSASMTTCNVGAIQFSTPNCPAITCLQHGISWTVGSCNTGSSCAGAIAMTAGATTASSGPGGGITFTGGASTNAAGGSIVPVPGAGMTAGFVQISALTTRSNADFLCVDGSGDVFIQSSACTISSKRFKTAIHPLQSDALGEIAKLPVETFRLKAKNPDPNASADQIGLSAEDVAQIEPRCAVYESDMKTPKSYRQECIIAMLVRAVQEQQREIKRLQH